MTQQHTTEWYPLPRLRPNGILDFFDEETGDTFLCWSDFRQFLRLLLGEDKAEDLKTLLMDENEYIYLDITVRPLPVSEAQEHHRNRKPFIQIDGSCVRLYYLSSDGEYIYRDFETMTPIQRWIEENLPPISRLEDGTTVFQPYKVHLKWGRADL